MNLSHAYTYQLAAAEGASHLGLIVLVYDAIARDLVGAGNALRDGNIEQRCLHSKHALSLLAHLEDWVKLLDDLALSDSLNELYRYWRARIMLLQATTESAGFFELAALVAEVRAAWQTKERRVGHQTRGMSDSTDSSLRSSSNLGSQSFSFHA